MKSNISYQTFEKKKNSRLRNRRAITDIISTMMLMGVTVTGASTLTYFMNDAFVSGNLGTVSTLETSSLNLLLLAYDTRDSSSLLELLDVDNDMNAVRDSQGNPILCGTSCSGDPNAIPESDGTEFIVMQVQNNGIDPIFLEDVSINGVNHSWDFLTSGVLLDASVSDPLSGKYPADGMFSIIPVTNPPLTQSENIKIDNGQTVNILVKLGPDDSDIQLNKGIRVLLNTGAVQPVEFVLESGDAR